MRRFQIFIFTLISFCILSCSKERQYEISVKNHTDYHLNVVSIGRRDDSPTVEVGVNSISAPVSITYKKSWGHFFTEPLLSIAVLSYSDSTSTYENSKGGVISESSLREGKTNFIIVESILDYAGELSFKVSVE